MPRVLKEVLEGHQLAALGVLCVHAVIDGDVADTELGEALLDVQSSVQLVAAQAGEVLSDDDTHFAVLHIGQQPLEVRAIKICHGVAVIHIELWVRKVVVSGVLFQNFLLRIDLSRVNSAKEYRNPQKAHGWR